jgi:hypothetical protein
MSPRWDTRLGPPSTRDTAMLAEVLQALREELRDGAQGEAAQAPDVGDLISAALAELQRMPDAARPEGGVAPVLGSGVVQEILRRRAGGGVADPADAPPALDERR